MVFKKSLAQRHQELVNTPNNYVSGGGESLAISSGDLVSPERSSTPTGAGVQQYMMVRVFGGAVNTHASEVANITPYGMSNLIQRLEFTDSAGYIRHSGVSGRTLELFAYARQYDVVGGSLVEDSNYGVSLGAGGSDVAPATIAAGGGTASFSHTFIIPFAYSAVDQRSAIPVILHQGQQTLKLRFPTKAEAFVASAANKLKALYSGGTVAFTSFGYEVLTITKNRNLPSELPEEVFADVYQLSEGVYTDMATGVDRKIPLGTGRVHYNAFLLFDNGGTLNYETDVNSLSVLYGGTQDAKRCSPKLHNAIAKNTLKAGIPPACYYFNFRDDPLDVMEKGGSVDLILNPASLNSGATLYTAVDFIQRGVISSLKG